MKILIVENEPSLNKSMTQYLSSQGYCCESVTDYSAVTAEMDVASYDCIVVDIMPDGSALHLLQQLKAENKMEQLIIISAQEMPDDKIGALKENRHDFLMKPFHLAELSMRVSAIIRKKQAVITNVIKFREITLDTNRREVTINGQHIILTKTEYRLLLYFLINKNKVLTMTSVAEHIWRDEIQLSGNFDFIYTHIKNLRKKLQAAGCGNYLHNVYGIGYRFS